MNKRRKYYLVPLLLLMLALPAQAEELRTSEPLRCPNFIRDEDLKHNLRSTSVFEGNKANNLKELNADNEQWNLEDYRPSVKNFYLLCYFEGIEWTLTIPIPPGMRLCQQDGKNVVCR